MMSRAEALTVLVTGTSSGFGKLIAQTLAENGHHVYASMRDVSGRNAGPAADLRGWARQQEARLEVVELDVTDDGSVRQAIDSILDSSGHIDVVVNNAGTGNAGILEGFTMDQVQTVFDINAFGALRVDKAVLPSMRARGSGLLIHITSTTGRIVIPFISPYSAAKFALEAFAEELSFELAPFGVESVIVEPGGFGTEGYGKYLYPADSAVLAEYGDMATKPQEMFAGLAEMLSQPGAPDPQEVADSIQRLVALPAGQRPLRTVVGSIAVEGVETLNQSYENSKRALLETMGAG